MRQIKDCLDPEISRRIRKAFKEEEQRAKEYWAEYAKGKTPDQISVPFPRFYIGKLERELKQQSEGSADDT